jgi:hypothetical protein
LSLLRNAEGPKWGTRNRRLTAGWDTAFLEKVLRGAPHDYTLRGQNWHILKALELMDK